MVAWLLGQNGSEGYMPHGMCYLWEPDLVWLHVVSDALTTLAYWAIPPFLINLARPQPVEQLRELLAREAKG